MSLYPSLEDMKVDHMIQAQTEVFGAMSAPSANTRPNAPTRPASENMSAAPAQTPGGFYPGLAAYMGLELSEDVIRANMPEYLPSYQQGNSALVQRQNHRVASSTPSNFIAPISSESPAFSKSQLTHGIRQVILCRDGDGKVGLRVKAVDKGIFVALVAKGSPAAMGGMKFGDQILQINNETVAGYSAEKVHAIFKKIGVNNIVLAVRDRPFERTLTLHKDSTGHVGFQFKEGKITAIVVDSSAARNGLLIEHNLLEINGQNVVGLKDRDVSNIIDEAGQVVTITVIPNFLYRHIMKNMSNSLVKKMMDHSVIDL